MELMLKLTIDQVNSILSSLTKRPFEEVVELINSIQEQASKQLNPPPKTIAADGV